MFVVRLLEDERVDLKFKSQTGQIVLIDVNVVVCWHLLIDCKSMFDDIVDNDNDDVVWLLLTIWSTGINDLDESFFEEDIWLLDLLS